MSIFLALTKTANAIGEREMLRWVLRIDKSMMPRNIELIDDKIEKV